MDRRTLRLLLPRQLRELPADLASVVVLTLLVNVAVFAPVIRETPLRVPLGLLFVLLVPGYAFIAALFPEQGESPGAANDDDSGRGDADDGSDDGSIHRDEPTGAGSPDWLPGGRSGIDGIERAALSFGLSIALVPLIGLALSFTPWGIRLVPIMVALSAFSLAMVAVAAGRRWRLPPEERFAVPWREWLERGRGATLENEDRTDAALNLALAASVVLAVGVLAFAVLFPPTGEAFSAIYVLTEDEDGDLVAAGYPEAIEVGDSAEVVLGVDNHEREDTHYTVVAIEQEVQVEGNQSTVLEQRELDRIEFDLAYNETWMEPYEIEPTLVGEDVRIAWLLFVGDEAIPDEPGLEDTEYSVHIWVDVIEAE